MKSFKEYIKEAKRKDIPIEDTLSVLRKAFNRQWSMNVKGDNFIKMSRKYMKLGNQTVSVEKRPNGLYRVEFRLRDKSGKKLYWRDMTASNEKQIISMTNDAIDGADDEFDDTLDM